MQANFARNLMESHALLCNLERELGKERDGIVQTYTHNRTLYGSYFPMLEHYRGLEDQYVAALSKFRELLQATIPIPDNNHNMVTSANPSDVNMTRKIATNPAVNNNNITNNNVNGNYPVNNNNNNNGNMNTIPTDDGKQQEISTSPPQPQPQPQPQRITDVQPPQQPQQPPPTSSQVESEEMKVSALYNNTELSSSSAPTKPPVRSSNVSQLPPVMDNQHVQHQQHQPQHQQQPETVTVTESRGPMKIQSHPPVRTRKRLHVSRHKYKYEGRGFDIWRRNLQRPIYTATTLRINRKFRGDDKLVRKFLYEKGGFKPELIEQVTFIQKRGEDKNGKSTPRAQRGQKIPIGQIEFTIVRVRASLRYIYQCIDKIEQEVGKDVIRKQNNRSRPNNNPESRKLNVNNFDIADKNTHINLTKIFLKYGDLEQDIFIGRDRAQNPYAIVEYREVSDAKRCVNAHSNYQSTIFFPQISAKDLNDNNGGDENRRFLNRRLHISYYSNSENNNNNNNNNNRGSRRGRGGRGRGSRRSNN